MCNINNGKCYKIKDWNAEMSTSTIYCKVEKNADIMRNNLQRCRNTRHINKCVKL